MAKKDVVVVKAPSSTFRATISLKRKYAHLIKLIDEYPIQSEKSMFMADLMMDGLKFREMFKNGTQPGATGVPQIAAAPPTMAVKELSEEEMDKKFNNNFFTVIAPTKKVEETGLKSDDRGNNGEAGPEENAGFSE